MVMFDFDFDSHICISGNLVNPHTCPSSFQLARYTIDGLKVLVFFTGPQDIVLDLDKHVPLLSPLIQIC